MTTGANESITSQRDIVISVDAMGGDRGPLAVVAGMAATASKTPNVRYIVHGDAETLRQLIGKRRVLADRCDIRHAARAVSMDEKPSQVMRNGKDTSMWGAIDSVRNHEAEVAVSCGNTGALMAVSMVRLRKLAGVSRPAIAILWPSDNPQGFNVMLDVGADVRADPNDLLQYALMGVSYARNGLSLKQPRVGILNVGTEETKGRPELKEASALLAVAAPDNGFDYIGYVEGSDIPSDKVDIIVTDGFTGNVAIKTAEGTASFVRRLLEQAFRYTPLSRIGALFALTSLRRLGRRIDPRRVNGGVFLGLNGTVIKSHGGADATGIAAAIGLAIQLAQSGFSEKLAARVASRAPERDNDNSTAQSRNPKA